MSHFGKICFVGGRGALHSINGSFSGVVDNPDVWEPAADLMEVEGGFLVQVDLPGVDANSVEVLIDGQTLVIRGVRPAVCPHQTKRYIHMEVSRGEFGKAIALPEQVSDENCRAVLRHGVLEIFLPFGSRHFFSVMNLRIQTLV